MTHQWVGEPHESAYCKDCEMPKKLASNLGCPDGIPNKQSAYTPSTPQRDTTTLADIAASLRRIEELLTKLAKKEKA